MLKQQSVKLQSANDQYFVLKFKHFKDLQNGISLDKVLKDP